MIWTSDKERIERLTAERDEARRDAGRWQSDALRLLNERNAAQAERDDARQEACCLLSSKCDLEAAIPVGTIVHSTGPSPEHFARIRGWDCFEDIAIDPEDGAP